MFPSRLFCLLGLRGSCCLLISVLLAAPTRAQVRTQFAPLGQQVQTSLGYGTGTYGPVILADLDGDGDLDLVVRNRDGNRIALNDGRGGFTPGSPLGGILYETTAGAAGDVDGDGDLDLIFATDDDLTGPVQNQLYLNDGAGRFTNATSRLPQAADSSYAVAVGDVDGDGDLDIYFGIWFDRGKIYLNDGQGRFTAGPRCPITRDQPSDAAFGDADGDGDLDIVVATSGQNRLFRNDGRGTFIDASSSLPQRSDRSMGLTFADLDADGDRDLVFATLRGQNTLYRNDGRGGFLDATTALPVDNDESYDVVARDMNGDRHIDLVFANWNRAALYLNDGRGGYVDVTATKMPPLAAGLVALGDVDADGDVDAFFTTNPPAPRLYLNAGDGTLQPADGPARQLGLSIQMAFADLDGDGDQDYVSLGNSGRAMLNDGRGGFRAAPGFRSSTFAQDIVLQDVDGDGDPDCVITTFLEKLRLLLNDGAGVFTDVTSTHVQGSAARFHANVELGDVDGDGDPDLVATVGDSGVVGLFLNDGRGRFTDVSAAQMPQFVGVSEGLALGDIDGDRDLDIVIALPSGSVKIYINDGKGQFTDALATTPSGARGVALADVDLDGDLDLVTTHCVGPARLHLNDGAGRFKDVTGTHMPARRLDGSAFCNYIIGLLTPVFVDIDEDGDVDLLIEGTGSSKRVLYVNNGRGVFRDETDRQTGIGLASRAFALADVDGDGDLDLLTNGSSLGDRLLFNLRRHIHAPRVAVLGRDFEIQAYARHSPAAAEEALLFVSTQTASIPLGSLGVLRIQPNGMIRMPGATILQPPGVATIRTVIPTAQALLGMRFYLQAVIGPAAGPHHLSNVLSETVIR